MCCQIFGTKGCIISLHLVAVEADHQIPKTGPIRESMAAWVERLNFTLVEQIQRRSGPLSCFVSSHLISFSLFLFHYLFISSFLSRICQSPEKSIIRGYLTELFVRAHLSSLPEAVPPKTVNEECRDDPEAEPRVILFLFVCLFVCKVQLRPFAFAIQKLLGWGKHHHFSADDRKDLKEFLRREKRLGEFEVCCHLVGVLFCLFCLLNHESLLLF